MLLYLKSVFYPDTSDVSTYYDCKLQVVIECIIFTDNLLFLGESFLRKNYSGSAVYAEWYLREKYSLTSVCGF